MAKKIEIKSLMLKADYRIREKLSELSGRMRTNIFRMRGMIIGKTVLPEIYVTWPSKIKIGDHCILEHGIYIKYASFYTNGYNIEVGDRVFIGSGCEFNISEGLKIGDDGLIASGCRFIDHDHGYLEMEVPINRQIGKSGFIKVENNVWIGVNSVILKGVVIGEGAIIAAGSVVTNSIPPNEIWGGIPAKKIKNRW